MVSNQNIVDKIDKLFKSNDKIFKIFNNFANKQRVLKLDKFYNGFCKSHYFYQENVMKIFPFLLESLKNKKDLLQNLIILKGIILNTNFLANENNLLKNALIQRISVFFKTLFSFFLKNFKFNLIKNIFIYKDRR